MKSGQIPQTMLSRQISQKILNVFCLSWHMGVNNLRRTSVLYYQINTHILIRGKKLKENI